MQTHLSLATRQSLLLTSKYDFTLRMEAFITNDKIIFATHLQIRMTQQMNMFIASDERVLCWGKILLVQQSNDFTLEMNTLLLETNVLKMRI